MIVVAVVVCTLLLVNGSDVVEYYPDIVHALFREAHPATPVFLITRRVG